VECNRVTKPTASLSKKFKKLCGAVVRGDAADVIDKLNAALRKKYGEELTEDAEENIDDLAPAERVEEAVRRMLAVESAFRSHDVTERTLSFVTETAVTADHESGGLKQLCGCDKCVGGRPTPEPDSDSDDD
jgi:methylase of polypeptide subunit release factors